MLHKEMGCKLNVQIWSLSETLEFWSFFFKSIIDLYNEFLYVKKLQVIGNMA